MDLLQEKIRKTKCPIVLDLAAKAEHIPAHIREGKTEGEALAQFSRELMVGLKGVIPAVRFHFDQWALLDALNTLSELLRLAKDLGYYVLLDGPAVLSPWAAERAAALLEEGSAWPCDGVVVSSYIGSDAVKPFLPACKQGKSAFFTVRTPNKSAAELQDLMTGSRLTHVAAAETVNRLGEAMYTKSGYSPLGVVTAATNANAVMGLRSKYKRLFLLVDGLDYPGGNGKNCSYGFDRFGHGCAISVGPAITNAWSAEGAAAEEYVSHAVQAAERIRNNMNRYTVIL